MSHPTRKWKAVGFVIHLLIGVILIVAGGPKLLGLAPPEHVARMGLTNDIQIVGAGEVVTGALLIIPQTRFLGILMSSAFWGGAISAHMTHGESYLVPAIFLAVTWAGAYLRMAAPCGTCRTCDTSTEPAGRAQHMARFAAEAAKGKGQ